MQLVLDNSDCVIIAIGHPAQVAEYKIATGKRISTFSGGIPGVIALVGVAAGSPKGVVVCPDSVVGHIAANWHNIACISLWSSFPPSARVGSYANHRPIYNKIKCSPCWSHEQHHNPKDYRGCPLTACNDYCAGLRTIPPARIAEAVSKALAGDPS
jgi:hypothetical protein